MYTFAKVSYIIQDKENVTTICTIKSEKSDYKPGACSLK